MKDGITLVLLNAVAILFVLLAGFIIYLGRDGWGWCMFCAVLTTSSSYTKKTIKKGNSETEHQQHESTN